MDVDVHDHDVNEDVVVEALLSIELIVLRIAFCVVNDVANVRWAQASHWQSCC